MSRTLRANFTDAQKAEIFVRDRATCAFTGRCLWILDYGAGVFPPQNWAEHVIPCARGGEATVENGVCAWAWENLMARDKPDKAYLFQLGEPTDIFDAIAPEDRQCLLAQRARFDRLHPTDWLFNQALDNILCAVSDRGCSQADGTPSKRKRDPVYYANAALKRLQEWRRKKARVGALSLEERGLVPGNRAGDQELLWQAATMTTADELLTVIEGLVPFWVASLEFTTAWTTRLGTVLRKALENPYLTANAHRFITEFGRNLGLGPVRIVPSCAEPMLWAYRLRNGDAVIAR